MKKYLVVVFILLFLLSNFVRADDTLTSLIWTLSNHRDPEERKNAAVILGTLRVKSSVKALIDCLSDENAEVRTAVYTSLVKITKQNIPLNQGQWLEWWDKSGSRTYENLSIDSQELAKLKTYLNIAFIVMLLEMAFILLFIFIFSFMGGAKIKEMKEINRRAEHYISDADGVSKRFEDLFEEIEKRRNELAQFFTKLRDDNQNEIERFSDLVQQNIEHHLREASRNLREKSEAELKQTLTMLKEDMEHLIKKAIAEQLEKSPPQPKQ